MNTKLWYAVPAASFCEAMPIGNGSLGAMVYGKVPEEYITLNLDTLWSGTGRRKELAIDKVALLHAKKLCMSGKYYEAQKIIEKKLLGQYNESYMPLGILRYQYCDVKEYTSYKRELDLEHAVVSTEFTYDRKYYRSEIFASYPDNAIILHFFCDTKKKLNVTFELESRLHSISMENGKNGITIIGNAPTHVEPNYVKSDNPIVYESGNLGMPFCCSMKVKIKDGMVHCVNDKVFVEKASEILVLLAASDGYQSDTIEIDFSMNNCIKKVDSIFQKVEKITYQQIMNRHLEDYQPLFKQSKLYLNEEDNGKTTDRRLKDFKEGASDFGLYCLYYHYNRYLLISSSRRGTQPSNLQGIWNESIRPVWSSNWTININTEMNYWLAGICNLTECFEPLLSMVEQISKVGQETAKNYFHCRGWVANHNVDIWRHTEPVSGMAKYAFWPMGGVWLSVQIYDYFKYTGDTELLEKRIYPIMKGAVQFSLDWLEKGQDGRYHTPLSTSPENTFRDWDEKECSVSYSSTMDISLIKELFKNYANASNILGIEDELLEQVRMKSLLLPEYQVGKNGQLQEWIEDFTEEDPAHRHFSALVGFYPGTIINIYDTPELIESVKHFLDRRLSYGGGHIGWSCAWLINFFARLGDGDKALRFLNNLLIKSSYDNLFDLHPPLGENEGEREVFQIDGNLGAASGIANMLLRSCYGRIELLPALPTQWENGEVTGLLAEGGIEVDIKWREGKLIAAGISTKYEKRVQVKYQNQVWNMYLKADKREIINCRFV